MREYRDDATSVLSLVPLWNPSDEDSWSDLMEMGVNGLEQCLRIYQADVADLTKASFQTKIQAYVAAVAAHHLEIADCFHEFHSLRQQQDIGDDLLHERYAILIMKSHLTLAEFLEGAASVEKQVTNDLDAIAATVLTRMDSTNISLTDRSTVVSLLMKILYDEQW